MSEKDTAMFNIVTGVGTTILMIVILGLLIWAYYYDKSSYLFIIIVNILFIIYTSLNIAYVTMNSEEIPLNYYNIIFGSSIYILIITFAVFVLFCLKFFQII